MSDSLPFLTPSSQAGTAQQGDVLEALQMLGSARQTPLAHEAPFSMLPQLLPLTQGVQLPPQSISVSSPFLRLAVQLPGAQQGGVRPALQAAAATTQVALWHEEALRAPVAVPHMKPSMHGLQVPPQSISVSSPLRTWSVQLGAAQHGGLRPSAQADARALQTLLSQYSA